MIGSTGTIRVVIPLTIRKRNGRPKILPPDEMTVRDGRSQDPHVLRAIARAWNWRRQLEAGAASNIQDIAATEKVSDRKAYPHASGTPRCGDAARGAR
jgi:hypothetical protein